MIFGLKKTKLSTGWYILDERKTNEVDATFSVCLLELGERSKVKNPETDGRENIQQDWGHSILLLYDTCPLIQ